MCHAGDRTLGDCFKLFDIIHKVTTSTEVITRITTEVCLRDPAPCAEGHLASYCSVGGAAAQQHISANAFLSCTVIQGHARKAFVPGFDRVRVAAVQMCQDLAADNVMYAEIRTTPKNRPESNITKRSYTGARNLMQRTWAWSLCDT